MSDERPHLTAEQVVRILEIVQDTDAVIIGGQSINLWARHYERRDPDLAARGPFTSKDIDFYGNSDAASKLAQALGANLYLPQLDDQTPNAALVIGTLDDRKVEIDFMRAVLGVEDASIKNNFVTLCGRNPQSGAEVRLMLLHPLDCLRSRLANINRLKREDELSLRQAAIAIDILKNFIEELLAAGERKRAQTTLHDLFYVTRDEFIQSGLAQKHGNLNPLPAMQAFIGHPVLDERWRNYNLAAMIGRLEQMLARQLVK
jgi:hypothetical protein